MYFLNIGKFIWDLFSALDDKQTEAAAQKLLLNQCEIVEGSSAEFVSPKKKRMYKQKLKKARDEGESLAKKNKDSLNIQNKTDSSSVEPQSDMSTITVDSSKEQKDVSVENPVNASGNVESQTKAEIPPQLPPDIPPEVALENSDVSVDIKSVSLGSVANGVIDASYASDVSSKLNTSKEQEALNSSFE